MIIVKFIVLIGCINVFSASQTNYCEICLNHTLCQYRTNGPSSTCISYDSSGLLSSQDITELVKRINERRNFVAIGHSKILPQAANMKTIRWSAELATFAQRWADQCDPSVLPDKEDQCRDLENIKVGQNVGSVIGPSPGLNVKSFVEIWFIHVLDYEGSVTYYNKSRDAKTNYFTQVIWADTEFVGCGKSRFYVDARDTMLERLVCNFAPKGNIHGQPVYSIGYPATQCKTKMVQDSKYKGLCAYEDYGLSTRITTQRSPVNSLLRIINLSNDSVKHEIDPIGNNIIQINVNSNSSNEQRNQKTRHIFANKTYAVVKRIPPLRKQNIGKGFINISGNNDERHHQHEHERGHSHLYHGYELPSFNYEMTTVILTTQDFRRYDQTTEPMKLKSNNYRKFYQNVQCTRRMRPTQNECALDSCTRETNSCCQETTLCPSITTEIPCINLVEDHTCPPRYIPSPSEICSCIKQTCPSISTICNYEMNCRCSESYSTNTCYTTRCPEIHGQNNDFNDYKRSGTLQYYDMIPNVVVRSGNYKIQQESTSQKEVLTIFYKSDNNKSYKTIYEGKGPGLLHKDVTSYPNYKLQDHDYVYRFFDSSLRKRRQLEDQITLKPFWQIDNYNHRKPSPLKGLRYTTLANRKNRKTRKSSESGKWSTSTEPITLKMADYAEDQEHITEKYLSFNELMHLRKISDGYAQYDLRRQGKTTTKAPGKVTTKAKVGDKATTKPKAPAKSTTKTGATTTKKAATTTKKPTQAGTTTKTQATTKSVTPAPKTTEYTPNTPFERKKHCTRKLTCTWTAFTTNEGGENFGQIEYPGSRTPPGYVDGCTRTSTCTRDYMDRNKISTLPDDSSSDPTSEDEDYCERRSLNIQRRNSDDRKSTALGSIFQDYTDFTITTAVFSNDLVFNLNTRANIPTSVLKSVSETHDCICNNRNTRRKRHGLEYLREKEHHHDNLILNKILNSNQANIFHTNQSTCNGSIISSTILFLFSLTFLIYN